VKIAVTQVVADRESLHVLSFAVGHHFIDQALLKAQGAWNKFGWPVLPPLGNGSARETGRSMSQWNEQDVNKCVEEVRAAGVMWMLS
jgi:hypothetical protein